MTRYAPQWIQASTYSAAADRRLIGAIWPAAAIVGCAVSPSSAMTLNIAAGQVAIPTSNSTGSVLCTSDAVEQVTLAAAPASGLNRIDLVVAQARAADIDGGSNNDFVFAVVKGVEAATGTVPTVPPNSVALAQVAVAGGTAAIVAGNITDARPAGLVSAGAPGDIKMIAFATPDPGWLLCDGAAVSRALYGALFAKLGTVWGTGDGSTTFNVPDLRGRAPIGAGTGTGLTARALGASGGEEAHVLSVAELAAHGHPHPHTHGIGPAGNPSYNMIVNVGSSSLYLPTSGAQPVTGTGQTSGGSSADPQNAGSNGAHNTMPPFRVVNYVVKT